MSESQQAITAIRLTGPLDALLRHRSLTWELARRDILGRYRGASFGLLWSLISPFLMLIIYTLAFGYILKSRWPGTSGNIADFAMLLFVGLIVHGFFAECLTRAPTLITGNTNLVKRIVFPAGAAVDHGVFRAVPCVHQHHRVLVLNLVVRGELHATVLFLPFVYAPLAIGLLGVGWLLSSLSVFLRDITQITGVLATAMLFFPRPSFLWKRCRPSTSSCSCSIPSPSSSMKRVM